MNRMAAIAKTDFILLLGDNFYWDGVKNVDDARFDDTFQATFNQNLVNLRNMTFWMQSGNHDYRGNISAQIKYSSRQDRWKFPALWYNIKKEVERVKT